MGLRAATAGIVILTAVAAACNVPADDEFVLPGPATPDLVSWQETLESAASEGPPDSARQSDQPTEPPEPASAKTAECAQVETDATDALKIDSTQVRAVAYAYRGMARMCAGDVDGARNDLALAQALLDELPDDRESERIPKSDPHSAPSGQDDALSYQAEYDAAVILEQKEQLAQMVGDALRVLNEHEADNGRADSARLSEDFDQVIALGPRVRRTSATESDPTRGTRSATEDDLPPGDPTPEVPAPEVSASEVPAFETPTPEASGSEVPTPQVPTTQVPTTQTPELEPSVPEIPAPEQSAPSVPEDDEASADD